MRLGSATVFVRGARLPMPPGRRPWGGFMATLADPEGDACDRDRLRDA